MTQQIELKIIKAKLKELTKKIEEYEELSRSPSEEYDAEVNKAIEDYKYKIVDSIKHYEQIKDKINQQHQLELDSIEEECKNAIDKIRNEFYIGTSYTQKRVDAFRKEYEELEEIENEKTKET